jgi:hypothetical protein
MLGLHHEDDRVLAPSMAVVVFFVGGGQPIE